MTGRRGLLAIAVGAAVLLPAVVPAGAPRLDQAEAALAAAQGAHATVPALVEAVRTYEAALAAVRDEVRSAARRERELRLALATRHERVTRLLAVLEIASRTPPTTGGLHPQGPLAASRAGALIAALEPDLKIEAAELVATLEEMAAARREQSEGMASLGKGLGGLDTARDALRAALATPSEPGPDLDNAALIRQSDTLTELAAALADGQASADEAVPGELAWPLAGQVVIGFEERDAGGARRPGLVIAAPPQALVSAPADGEVRYAGPFLDYGYVVALQPRAGTMVVLAGLAELHVRAGATVRRGDLLGLLGGRTLDAEDYVMLTEAGTGAGAEETLYVEIRHGTGPVDPAPWFAVGNG